MTYSLAADSSNVRITGAIASYMARVSSQSWMRLASFALLTPMRLTRGLNAGLSSTAKQSSMYEVCNRRRRGIFVRRLLTNIAIAKANSCADSSWPTQRPCDCSTIRIPPDLTGRREIPSLRVGNCFYGCFRENSHSWGNFASRWRQLVEWLQAHTVNFCSFLTFENHAAESVQ